MEADENAGTKGVARAGRPSNIFRGQLKRGLPEIVAFASAGKRAFGEMDDHQLPDTLLQQRSGSVTQGHCVESALRITNLKPGGLARLDLIQNTVVHVLQGRVHYAREAVAVFADDIHTGLDPGGLGICQQAGGFSPVLGIGLIQCIQQQQITEVENAWPRALEIQVRAGPERVGAAGMEKSPAPVPLFGHDVGIGSRSLVCGPEMLDVDFVSAAIVKNSLPKGIFADHPGGQQWKGRPGSGQVHEHVVGGAARSFGLATDIPQLLRLGVNIDYFYLVDDPVATSQQTAVAIIALGFHSGMGAAYGTNEQEMSRLNQAKLEVPESPRGPQAKISFPLPGPLAKSLLMPASPPKPEQVFRGIPVSAGVCRGKILVLDRTRPIITRRKLQSQEMAEEVGRLEKALIRTRQQITEIQRRVSEGMGAEEGSIFDAHLLVLEDRTLLDEVVRVIQKDQVNAEYAFHAVAERYAATLAAIEDDYLRERATDMRDVTARVLNNLLGLEEEVDLRYLKEPCIVISHDLTPSNTAQLDKRNVLGFATDVGSKTSHTAIMARSLRIPAVVGLKEASSRLQSGEYALLDGFDGVIIVNPSDQTLYQYGQLARKQVTLQEMLRDVVLKPAVTLDGHRIFLSANIESPKDAEAVKSNGAEGVGLFRTEYLFINRELPPNEEQQFEAYYEAARALKPLPVVIRTLDLGGDKFLAHLPVPRELNPFLGWRAIRFCLQERDIFREQLRAILRASAEGNIKMMYPMISGLDELNQANALVEEYKAELRAENVAFDEQLEIGAMIETPSAVVVADSLAKRLKFFSIGTNDLIQYSLAVDRMNEKIAHLYEPTHPAIVRLLKNTIDSGHSHKIWVSVCGEMASDPTLTPLLLGLGVDELSVAPPLVGPVKFLIRQLNLAQAKELAEFALQCESAADILARCQEVARQVAPALFENK